jgi:formylglycine-generating enzyme required for sulfatase activity
VVVAKCPHCQQSIAGPLSSVAGRWTCPSCQREIGTTVEKRDGTLVEGRPTPFQPERLRDAGSTQAERRAATDAGATMAENRTVAEGAAKPSGGPRSGETIGAGAAGAADGGDAAVAERRAGPGGGDPLIGRILGGCRITEVLGRGAMGTVYKATQLSLDRIVALKVIREELCTDDDLLQRFQREAKTIGRFSTPHVVQIHDVGREQGVHFLVMEFVSGGSLLAHVNELTGRRLPPADAIRWMIEAAEGLLEAERLQIVHRDVKPENILLDHAARVKVADFGISRSITMSVELTATQAVIGTPLYMSPEQCRAEKVDHRSDMYSLGATFCHLLAGKRPLHEDSVQELLRKKTTLDFLSPRKLAQDGSIPESLSRVIERMTALDRTDRYPSFKDVIEDLRRVERGEIIEPFQSAAARARLRRRLVKSAVALVILGTVSFVGWRGYEEWKRIQREKQELADRRGGGTPIAPAAKFTAAQLAADATQLRARIRDRLVSRDAVDALRDHARRAADGADSKAALALLALCDDAEALVAYQADPEVRQTASYALPFADLERHWKRLRELRGQVIAERAGPELRDAVERDLKAREGDDAGKAVAGLARHLDDVEGRIAAGLGSADVRRVARRDLDEIDSGRQLLSQLFPAYAGEIAKADFETRSKAARARLDELDQKASPADAALTIEQATKKLRDLEQEFKTSGPGKSLQGDADLLRAQIGDGQPLHDEAGAFVNLVSIALDLRARLETIRLVQKPPVVVPFTALASFGDECREAQKKARQAAVAPAYAVAYAEFVGKELDRFFGGYETDAREAFAPLAAKWKQARDGLAAPGGAAALVPVDAEVAESRSQLTRFFGREPAFVAELLPAADVTAAAGVLERQRAHDASASAIRNEAIAAAAALDGVTSSAAWRAGGSTDVANRLAAAHAAADRAAAADSEAVDAATQRQLADLDARAKRWADRVARLDAALAHLSGDGRDLVAAGQALDALGDPELKDETARRAKAGVEALRQGFRALLDDLSIARARAAFQLAATELGAAAPDVKYAADCAARLDALETAVKDMAPVRGGPVVVGSQLRPEKPGEPVAVAAFWLDRNVVSIGEFQAFLADVKNRRDAVQRVLPRLPWLESAGLDAALDQLSTPPGSFNDAPGAVAHPRWPAENVTYAQAVVFLALRDRDLPTAEEWWLAAKGPKVGGQDHRKFAWDPSPTARFDLKVGSSRVCAGMEVPMAVDDGGVASGFSPQLQVHHLAGNAEQWTKLRRGVAPVVGGRFEDTEERRFSGEQPRFANDITKEPTGCRPAFRGVLRPRDFFALANL